MATVPLKSVNMTGRVRELVGLYIHVNYDQEDPRVKEWSLMGSPIKIVSLILTYLYVVKVAGPKYMKDRQPYDLRKVIAVYNVFQIFANAYIFHTVYNAGWNGKFTLGCEPVDYSDDPDAVKLLSAFWYLLMLKVLDFVETVFFVMRKKSNQVSLLHVYHHVSTAMFAWMACKWIGGGMVSFTIMPNTLVHVIMYTYYLLAGLGPSMQNKISAFKKYITILQMVQFCVILIHTLQAMSPSCPIPRIAVYCYVPNMLFFSYLFYDFYKKAYTRKGHKE